jgi:hypothetical protein
MGCAKFIKFFSVIFVLSSCVGFVFCQQESTETIQKEHRQFYGVNSEIDFNAILELDKYPIQEVLSITLHYNMAISALSAQWLADDEVVKDAVIPRGMNKSVTYTYNLPLPCKLVLRLKGAQGQIQVTSVEATVKEGLVSDQPMEKTTLQMERKTQTLKQAKFFRIVVPSARDHWEMGKTAVIHWNSQGIGGSLALELFRDRNRIAMISRDIPVKKGSYNWIVTGKDIFPGRGYQVRLTTLADKKSYVSETFSILEEYGSTTLKKYALVPKTLKLKQEEAAKPISLKILSPKYQDQWNVLQEYVIRWESEGLTNDDEIGIALKPISGKMAKIIGIVKNTGEFRYKVPYPLIFMGFDIQVIITPLKDRSIEVLSDPFAIMKPMVDLIANNPAVSYKFPQRRKKKWWEILGDVFTGGVTWYYNEVVELTKMKAEGTTMEVDVNVMNRGFLTRKDVAVDCSIQTLWRNVLFSFPRQTISVVYPDLASPVLFSAKTKSMNLEAGKYILEISIDPDNRAAELEPFRKNNRVTVEFEVK